MSEGKASTDPVEFFVKSVQNPVRDDLADAGLSELAHLARQAFEEKRRKQSLALANAILKIDSQNKEALVIRSWVRADLQKELESARKLAQVAISRSNYLLHERAETALRAILNIDPESEEAKALLTELMSKLPAPAPAIPGEETPLTRPPLPPPGPRTKSLWPVVAVVGIAAIAMVFGLLQFRGAEELPASPFSPAASQPPLDVSPVAAAGPEIVPSTGSIDLFVVPPQGAEVSVDDSPPQPVPEKIELAPGPHRLVFTAAGYSPETIVETVVAGKRHVLPIVMKPVSNNPSAPRNSAATENTSRPPAQTAPPAASQSKPPAATPPEKPVNNPPPVVPPGSLALSAEVPVDVYLGGRHMGTTPLTLKLAPGPQTLEFRYAGLEKRATYTINSNETARATVLFDVVLQINARPWAQVSIEGGSANMLGQTPLSDVKVPVGSVLVFQNPSFPEKKYRVTAKDTTIQVVFP